MVDDKGAVVTWRVHASRRAVLRESAAVALGRSAGELGVWLDAHAVADGTPFLIDPGGRYDTAVDRFFTTYVARSPLATQWAYAYDMVGFFRFLWENRGGRGWRDAAAGDRAAYRHWRLADPCGPRVALVSWDREVATLHQFYRWAVREGLVAVNPFLQRAGRRRAHDGGRGEFPAESSHLGPRRAIGWLPPVEYRRWRDVGVRGYTPDGLPDPGFRGRLSARNAVFADMMIRTGLRLAEQSAISILEVPGRRPGAGFARFWLPAPVAKGGSARWVYLPAPVLAQVWEYVACERGEAIERARADGVYERMRDPLIVEDPVRPMVRLGRREVNIALLGPAERRRLLMHTAQGLEPAALWLNEHGLPAAGSAWQAVFQAANRRCHKRGVWLRAHPHLLRHSFAVVTLEQLWRGHLADLAATGQAKDLTYQMVFGDPLNWVRIRLGHRSITTTQMYLHTLQELELETRLALVPDSWEPAAFSAQETGLVSSGPGALVAE